MPIIILHYRFHFFWFGKYLLHFHAHLSHPSIPSYFQLYLVLNGVILAPLENDPNVLPCLCSTEPFLFFTLHKLDGRFRPVSENPSTTDRKNVGFYMSFCSINVKAMSRKTAVFETFCLPNIRTYQYVEQQNEIRFSPNTLVTKLW